MDMWRISILLFLTKFTLIFGEKLVAVNTTETPPKLVISKLEKCNDHYFQNLRISFSNISVNYVGDGNVINFDMTLRDDIPANFTLVFHVRKCLNLNDLGCSEFFMGVAGKVCSNLNSTNGVWTKFVNNFSVPIASCPLGPGIYYLRNAKLTLEDLNTFPLDKGFHVVKAYGYVGKEIVMCLYSEMVVV